MSVYIIKSRLKFNIPLCVNYLIFMCFLLPYLQYQASNYTTNHTKLSIFVEFIYESKNIYEKKRIISICALKNGLERLVKV